MEAFWCRWHWGAEFLDPFLQKGTCQDEHLIFPGIYEQCVKRILPDPPNILKNNKNHITNVDYSFLKQNLAPTDYLEQKKSSIHIICIQKQGLIYNKHSTVN